MEKIIVKMEKILASIEKVVKMEKIHVLLKKLYSYNYVIVTIIIQYIFGAIGAYMFLTS